MALAAGGGPYKKAIHAFLMKVHPDFFTSAPELQKRNQESVAKLNELLTWARDVNAGIFKPPPSTSMALHFFRKSTTSDASSGGSSAARDATELTAVFSLPPDLVVGDATKTVVDRTVNKFLRNLLQRADCLEGGSTSSQTAAEEEEASRRSEQRPKGSRRPTPSRPVKTLLDETLEAVSTFGMPTSAPSIDELIQSDQIMFSKSLSPRQCAQAIATLAAQLPSMRYEQWSLLPLLVTGQFGVATDSVGTISVPFDFTLDQFLGFLRKEHKAIAMVRQSMEQTASEIEMAIAELCNKCHLDDVLISCPHREAIPFLRTLREETTMLNLYEVRNTTLEIGHHCGYRANGVVILDCRLGSVALKKKLAKLRPIMKRLQETYAVAKEALQSIDWHLKEFTAAVKPLSVDPFVSDASYGQRLRWAKELHAIGPRIAQWDWSTVTFVMGPMELNWSQGIMMLPHNFDGDNFVRYVTDVHRGAKERLRDQLKDFDMVRKKEAEDAAQLQASMASNAQEEFNALDAAAQGRPIPDAMSGALHPGAVDERGRREGATGPLAEYLTSSEQGGDALSVERPLAPPVAFAEEDVDEQLKWEGFYQSPFTADKTLAQDDAVRHMFLHTNRRHKDAAIKRLINEVRGKYPTDKHRYIGYKMGDYTKINDPRVSAVAYPGVTAAGTHSPGQ